MRQRILIAPAVSCCLPALAATELYVAPTGRDDAAGAGALALTADSAAGLMLAPPLAAEIAFTSIPGIAKTGFSDARYWDWQREEGEAVAQPALWSVVPIWDAITDRPLLPTRETLAHEVSVVLARNETECVALALTNTTWEKARTLEVTLSPFRYLDCADPDPLGSAGLTQCRVLASGGHAEGVEDSRQ